MTQRISRRVMGRSLVVLVTVLLIAGCAGTTTETTEAESTTSTAAATTTTAAAATTTEAPSTTVASNLPESPVTASLGVGANNTYKVAMGTFAALDFEESDLPVAPGSVEVRWYTSGDRYVVGYAGLDLAETGPLCPGNSILTPQGQFENVSNAPTEEGACQGFATVTTDPEVGPRDCDGSVLYVTAIPSDQEGTLFGSLEALADDGTAIIGLTSQAETSADIPEIDVDAVCPAA